MSAVGTTKAEDGHRAGMRAPSPRVRGVRFLLARTRGYAPLAELVIGPATSGRTRWQSDLSPRSGERKE
jgi:hypothetical protein